MYLNKAKKLDSAKKYLFDAYNLAKNNNLIYDIPIILANISWLFQQQKDYKTALNYALQAEQIISYKPIIINSPYIFSIICNLYQKLGDYKNALIYANKSNNASIKIYNQQKGFTIAELNFQKKLFEEKKQIEITHQRNYFIIAISIITITLLIIILIESKKYQKLLQLRNDLITQQNTKLQELNKTKDKFFSIIAHDLKNPIISSKGLSEILVNEYDTLNDNEKKELIQILFDSASQTSELLENLLNWSRSQRGKISFEPAIIDLKKFIKSNINLLQSQSHTKEIEIIYSEIPGLYVLADNYMINTIIRNLLSNAIKFTPNKGKIIISNEIIENDKIKISITDTGVGIPQEKIPKIFDISQKISSPGTNQEKGTGLGLILCKEFLEKHNSYLTIQSEVGKGTKITFELQKATQIT